MKENKKKLMESEKQYSLFNIIWNILTDMKIVDSNKLYQCLFIWAMTDKYFERLVLFKDGESWMKDCNEVMGACGAKIGIELDLPPLVAAVAYSRIMAAGEEVLIKWRNVILAVMQAMNANSAWNPLFEWYCEIIDSVTRIIPYKHEDLSEYLERTENVSWIKFGANQRNGEERFDSAPSSKQ